MWGGSANVVIKMVVPILVSAKLATCIGAIYWQLIALYLPKSLK
jgi:hypothetical protein